MIGVPLGIWLGQNAGWRWAYVAVAVIFAMALALGAPTLPKVAGDATRTPLREIAALANPKLLWMLGTAAIALGGFFAVYSYIAEATIATGLAESVVPWVVATLGAGMTLGNIVGGWASDRALVPAIFVGLSAVTVTSVLFALLASSPVALFVLAFLFGATCSTLIPSIQSRIISIAGKAELLGAALNHAAFNVGNALGAWLGGLVLAAGLGAIAGGWVGAALAVIGLAMMVISVMWDRRTADAEVVSVVGEADEEFEDIAAARIPA